MSQSLRNTALAFAALTMFASLAGAAAKNMRYFQSSNDVDVTSAENHTTERTFFFPRAGRIAGR